MAGISISATPEIIMAVRKKCISPSKVFHFGATTILEHGIDIAERLKQLKIDNELKTIKIEELQKKILNMRAEIEFLRPKAFKEMEREKAAKASLAEEEAKINEIIKTD